MVFEDVQSEEVSCLLCGESKSNVIFKGRDLLHDLQGDYKVVKCTACDMMRTNPRPSPESMGFYYPDDYGPYHITNETQEVRPRVWWKKLLRKILGRSEGDDSYYHALPVEQLKIGRALEIGCASGGYLDELKIAGWQVEGIEFSPLAAEKAHNKGHKVFAGSLESAPAPDENFDLIVGWMVLEHLHQPKLSLVRLSEWINDDGWLVLSVPNCDYFGWKLFKNYEYGVHLPAHLSHFTPKTISLMLAQSGWEVKKILHQRVLGSIAGSIGFYCREKLGINNRFVEGLINYDTYFAKINGWLFPITILLAFLGQTGRMTVWAQKKSPSQL